MPPGPALSGANNKLEGIGTGHMRHPAGSSRPSSLIAAGQPGRRERGIRTAHDGPSGLLKNHHDPSTDAQTEGDEVPGQAPCRGTEGPGELAGCCTVGMSDSVQQRAPRTRRSEGKQIQVHDASKDGLAYQRRIPA
jgi:hypothetical protein